MEEKIKGQQQHGDLKKTKQQGTSVSVVEERVEKEYQEQLLRINGEIAELREMMEKPREDIDDARLNVWPLPPILTAKLRQIPVPILIN